MSEAFPGFVYDKEKKCYFKILPSQFRNHDMKLESKKCSSQECNQKKDVYINVSIYKMLQSKYVWSKDSAHSERRLKEHLVPAVKSKPLKLSSEQDFQYKHILVSKTGQLLATYFDNPAGTFMDVHMYQSGKNYTRICQRQISGGAQIYHSADLFTEECHKVCVITNPYEVTFYSFGNSSERSPLCNTDCFSKPVTSVKLNCNKESLNYNYAVGFTKGSALICDHQHKNIHLNKGTNSDTMSLDFSWQDPILFTGHRNGMCFAWDLRCRPVPAMVVREKDHGFSFPTSVVKIHPLISSQYVVLNSLYANLHMWDLRARRSVLQFEGHVSDYKTYWSVTDHLQSFLTAVGSDGVIRYWSLQNGNLLGSFNSETEVVRSIAYSDSLLGKPSLLVADENLINVYTNYC